MSQLSVSTKITGRFGRPPGTVADTLLGAAHDLARRLDLSTLERLPASFVTEHLGQRHADMLWRIQTTDAQWLYLLVLLEFQSTIDRRMALRMTDYTVRQSCLDTCHATGIFSLKSRSSIRRRSRQRACWQ